MQRVSSLSKGLLRPEALTVCERFGFGFSAGDLHADELHGSRDARDQHQGEDHHAEVLLDEGDVPEPVTGQHEAEHPQHPAERR